MMEPVISPKVQTFQDTAGNSYNMRSIDALSRSASKSSVTMMVEGKNVTVEVTPTEALRIIELSD